MDSTSKGWSTGEFGGEESLKQSDGMREDSTSKDRSISEFGGEESLKQSDEMVKGAMAEDNSRREFLSGERGWGEEQEGIFSQESFNRPYTYCDCPSVNSNTGNISEYASVTTLKQSWINDMQLASMYLDEKVSER